MRERVFIKGRTSNEMKVVTASTKGNAGPQGEKKDVRRRSREDIFHRDLEEYMSQRHVAASALPFQKGFW